MKKNLAIIISAILISIFIYQASISVLSAISGIKNIISQREIGGFKGFQDRLQELINRAEKTNYVMQVGDSEKEMSYQEFLTRYKYIAMEEKKLLEKMQLIVDKFDQAGIVS